MIIFVSWIKYFTRPISVFANSILCSVLSLDQNYFWTLLYLQKHFSKYSVLTCCGRPDGRPALFQVRTVDRAVDRSSDRLVRACVHVIRSTGRSTGPHVGRPSGRPTDCTQLSIWDGRPGGRPGPANGQKILKTGRPAGRPWVYYQPNG